MFILLAFIGLALTAIVAAVVFVRWMQHLSTGPPCSRGALSRAPDSSPVQIDADAVGKPRVKASSADNDGSFKIWGMLQRCRH